MTQLVRDFSWVILLPASWLYSITVKLSLKFRKRYHLKIPVISVGNLHVGGTGKTPLVIQIAQQLETKNPAILSRGYRGRLSRLGAKLDRSSLAGPREFGDEPWEMSMSTSQDIYVGAHRLKVVQRFGIDQRYGFVLLDDGFQHVQLARDIDLLIIPGDDNPWEAACLPLGNLREGLSSIKRASTIVITCSDPGSQFVEDWKSIVDQLAPGMPRFVATRKLKSVIDLKGNKIEANSHRFGAFCGVGRPQRFLEDVTGWTTIHYSKTYPDHHHYAESDLRELLQKAKELCLEAFVTTSKDFYKVVDFFAKSDFPLFVARMGYDFENGFWEELNRRLEKAC